MRWLGRRAPQALCLLLLTTVAGCGADSPSTLSPSGPKAGFVTWAWWLLFAVAAFVCVVVIAMAVLAVVFRRRAKKVHQGEAKKFVMVFGVVLPALVLSATFALSVSGLAENAEPPSPTRLTIEVTGHQWWWEVHYAGTEAVTANEIHVPVGTPVRLRLQTADVIHSFWVPELNRKIDLIPGRTNRVLLDATRTGWFRGQCSEFCGLQHAHMAVYVVVQPKAQFRAWLADQAKDARAPATALERRGRTAFLQEACSACHQIRGTSAHALVGPDLTHLATRRTIAAATLPNSKGYLTGWILDPQHSKPGARMPALDLSGSQVQSIVAYLESLR